MQESRYLEISESSYTQNKKVLFISVIEGCGFAHLWGSKNKKKYPWPSGARARARARARVQEKKQYPWPS